MTPEELATDWLRERGAVLVGERLIENRKTGNVAHLFRGSRPDGTAARCIVVVVDGVPRLPADVTNADRKRIGRMLRRVGC